MLLLLTSLMAAAQDWNSWGAPSTQMVQRSIQFNGRMLSAAELATLQQIEQAYGTTLPDGAWWYDPVSGAIGQWGGPALGAIPAGLQLGGPLPAHASGGNTGVYFNGRQLHSIDLANLTALVGPIQPGRYFIDAQGNVGMEGGPVMGNLYYAAQAPQAPQAQRAPQSPLGQQDQGSSYYSDHTSATIVPGVGGMVCTGAGDCSSYSY